jgi:hypothetical protein
LGWSRLLLSDYYKTQDAAETMELVFVARIKGWNSKPLTGMALAINITDISRGGITGFAWG